MTQARATAGPTPKTSGWRLPNRRGSLHPAALSHGTLTEMKLGWAIAPALVIGLLVSTAPAAVATTRYATPGGSSADPNCDAAHPCNIERAINTVAQNGDEVVVAPGNYAIPTTLSVSGKVLNIHGQTGQPRPNVIASFAVMSLVNAAGSSVSHMRLDNTSAQSTLTANSSSVTLSDLVVVNSAGPSVPGTAVAIGVTAAVTAVVLRDSAVVTTGPSSKALLVGGVSGDANATAINVTVHALTSVAILVSANDIGGTHPAILTAKNTIARGAPDIWVSSSGSGTVPATTNLSYSNYRPSMVQLDGAGAVLNDQGHNQSTDPLFANPAAEDFHELAGSPTIDAGATDPLLGGLDFDGDPRVMGGAPDIGADELAPSPSPPGSQPRAPKLSLKGSKRQRVLKQRGVVVRVSCDQACTATANASVPVPGASKTYKFRKASKTLAASASAKLKLKLSKKALAAIRRALRRGKKLKAKVTVTAVTSGMSSSGKLTVRLRR